MNGARFRISILLAAGLLLPPLFFSFPPASSTSPPPANPLFIPIWEQYILFIAAFIVKPLYMALSLAVAFMLRRSEEPELRAIRWGMVLFFLGELACAGNYLLFRDQSLLMEYGHDYGMVSAFAFFVYALMETLDARILHYSDTEKRCALLPLCGGCYKQREMSCTLWTLFLYLLPALAAMEAMPLTAPIGSRFFAGPIFGERVIFGHPPFSQTIEVRFFPAVAAFFLLLSWGVLLLRREHGFAAAKALVAVGLGPLVFSLMRFLCYWGYAEHPLWADVWEELTELMFVIIILRIVLLVRSRRATGRSPLPSD